MTSSSALFAHQRQAGTKLLVPYLCAGFPCPEETLTVMAALSEAGADAIELGVPFSDPLLDGPVIQAAATQALRHGVTTRTVLDMAAQFTSRYDTPLVLMGSVNPLLRMGADVFAATAHEARVAGCILPDLPPDQAGLLPGAPPLIPLVAPNTPDDRVAELGALAPPFVYAVSVFGVTGTRSDVADYTKPFLTRVTALSERPVLAGFGIATPQHAADLAQHCDGVIVGSALLRALESAANPAAAAAEFLTPFRTALDALCV